MKRYSDGWHTVAKHEVYIKDGKIAYGVSKDGQRTVYPYIACNGGGWDNASGHLTPDAFRARIRRGTAAMK